MYNQKGKERVEHRNERLDPYSGRFFPRETRGQELGDLLQREARIENIVRERSWEVVLNGCGGLYDGSVAGQKGWEGALGRWRDEQGKRR